MRRMILAAVTSSLVLALAPAGAMARHHSHHKRHHARHHAKHRARVHRVIHRRFGDVNNPSTPTTNPGTTSPSSIGTVDSFDGTTLTIKLNSGSTVSGTVTNDTELECTSSSSSSVSTDMRRDGGGDNSGGDNGGSDGQSSQSGDQSQSGDDDSGAGDDEAQQQACSTSALAPGASVSGAELKISSAGAMWEKVDLIS